METIKKNKGFGHWIRTSITARMLMVGFLILVLLIPLVYIKELIKERSERQEEVVSEVGNLWGTEVLLMGPVLKVPYKTYTESTTYDTETKKGITKRVAHTNYAYFLPDNLNIDAHVDAIKKERGIYETSVFSSKMAIEGSFGIPDFKQKDVLPEDVVWEKATILIRSSNLKGIKNQIEMQLGTATTSFLPRYKDQHDQSYLAGFVPMHELESPFLDKSALPISQPIAFNTAITINGSSKIRFVPVGKQTKLHMTSNWADPSFTGSFLPEEDGEKSVSEDGFVANWNILQINRQFEQSFFGTLPDLKEFSFGTELFVPVDEYQKSERSTKYGYLVIALTFLVFFLIQTISKINIHAFQYLMIGIALLMFYTLLISISEHQNFLKAYAIASTAVIGLITLYSKSILKIKKFVLLIFGSLTTLYAFIFVIIQLESYSLLVGSIGLFCILGLVMFASRKIDWGSGC
ncbi:cell envelope integrity protein CreD [Maribacter chungangensis]|uniref:Cell envelope integrity protein CreD n=1 Tax=Maribacter chungangensis TaxID=1069117 RepID=A0ABW3B1M2_9FLAO